MPVGVVKSVEGKMATVLVERGEGCCDNCVKEACDVSMRGIETEAVNLGDARVGQKVRVEIRTFTYLKGVMVLYILPALALLFGAIAGRAYLPAYFPGTGPDLLSAWGGVIFFLVSLVGVKLLSGRLEKKTEHKPFISSIISGR